MKHESLVCGKTIIQDLSGGQGHCWRAVEDIPGNIMQEIEGEIIDGGKDACDDFVASNGQHYRWLNRCSSTAKKTRKAETMTLNDDQLTTKHTAFKSMQDLLEAKGGYFPCLRTQSGATRDLEELGRLADAYDAYQHARRDSRRAYRT